MTLGAKKGFGSSTGSTKKSKRASDAAIPFESTTEQQPLADASTTTSNAVTNKSKESQQMTAGQRALAEMRRKKAEEKDAELRRIREMRLSDQQVQETPAVIPEKVATRMGQRMLPFVGVPLFLSMGSLISFWYLATYKNMEFQPALVALVSSVLLIVGLLGITYSVMSTSWDPDRDEESVLGVDEFKKNLQNVQEGLSRSRENALLREKMAGLDESEIQAALNNLDRKESAESKRQQSLQDKFKDELD